MDRFRQMEVFNQVMESGNFTRAAHALGLPRSTVSTVIQQLEDRIGIQLLRRSTRQMVPTDEGMRFLKISKEIVDSVAETEQVFRQQSHQLKGRLRVDMPSRIGRRFIIPALPTLLEKHPDLHVEISTTDKKVDLISEGVDCVIRVGQLQDSDTICRKLGDIQMITCASPEYLVRRGTPKNLEGLARHEQVNYSSTLRPEANIFEYVKGNRIVTAPMNSRVSVNNAESYIAAACAGLGLIQIPAFDVIHLLKSGELTQVLENSVTPTMQLSLLYARRRNVPARIVAFQDWTTNLLREREVFIN